MATTTATFTLPACVSTFTFEIVGGGGAGYANGGGAGGSGTTPSSSRQNGARLTGQVTVPAGSTLSLIVGDGGKYAGTVGASRAGGIGYGNGGAGGVNPVGGAANIVTQSFGGGGGSAILLGSTPLVVAGGGGGFASIGAVWAGWGYGVNSPDTIIETPQWGIDYGSSSAGIAPNGSTRSLAYTSTSGTLTTEVVGAGPGIAATGAMGGSGGAAIAHLASATSVVDVRAPGNKGGDHGTGSLGGGDGAKGIAVMGTWHSQEGAVSGGGGGGWAGGGSGGAFGGWSAENRGGSYMYFGVAGAAGAGSSYSDSGLVTLTSSGSSGIAVGSNRLGHVGLIRISWS